MTGGTYNALAHNSAVQWDAVEALTIQRDHYRACIAAYNAGESAE